MYKTFEVEYLIHFETISKEGSMTLTHADGVMTIEDAENYVEEYYVNGCEDKMVFCGDMDLEQMLGDTELEVYNTIVEEHEYSYANIE